VPPNVRHTGLQANDTVWAIPDSALLTGGRPRDGPSPVTMSTIYQDQLEVLRRAARALGALPVRG